jgi:hypothetical protein
VDFAWERFFKVWAARKKSSDLLCERSVTKRKLRGHRLLGSNHHRVSTFSMKYEPTEPLALHPLGCSAAKRSHSETFEISALQPPAAMPTEAPSETALSGLQSFSATSFSSDDFLSPTDAAFNYSSALASPD